MADGEPLDDVKGLDEDIGDDQLTLVSQDDMEFTVSKGVAFASEVIKSMVEADKEETRIPLPNVKGSILQKIIHYMQYHDGNPAKVIERPLRSANLRNLVCDWDATFVELDHEVLFELILAANYLDIEPLLDLCCAQVASMLKGKPPEEIRKKFNIQNDFTPEEEEAVRAENKWAEES